MHTHTHIHITNILSPHDSSVFPISVLYFTPNNFVFWHINIMFFLNTHTYIQHGSYIYKVGMIGITTGMILATLSSNRVFLWQGLFHPSACLHCHWKFLFLLPVAKASFVICDSSVVPILLQNHYEVVIQKIQIRVV